MTQFNFTNEAPLWTDPDGTVRFKGSRITLDTLVGSLRKGYSVDDIQDSFPTLSIAQIYGGIAWYLNNQAAADEYLKQREIEADLLRRKIQSQPQYVALTKKLLERREQLIMN
jgi:uncharacterized protein (DUF433 family)